MPKKIIKDIVEAYRNIESEFRKHSEPLVQGSAFSGIVINDAITNKKIMINIIILQKKYLTG